MEKTLCQVLKAGPEAQMQAVPIAFEKVIGNPACGNTARHILAPPFGHHPSRSVCLWQTA